MICNHCHQDKPETEFNWKNKAKGLHHKYCRNCKRIYQDGWYQRHREEHIARTADRRRIWKQEAREYITDYLKIHPCKECGASDPMVLEFHHRDPKTKKMEVAAMIQGGWPSNLVIKEIAKCDVLCANCHRCITAKEQGWYKSLS